MADFPGSVFNPASRSAGQSIASAHINSVQAEVTAIEDGYRNATAPLNSSGSTVATLSVLGGSTFASRPVMGPPDALHIISTGQAIPANTTTALNWFTQTFLTNSSMHSTGTTPERLFPQSTGVYRISAQVTWASTANVIDVAIRDSSGLNISFLRQSFLTAAECGQVTSVLKRYDVTPTSTHYVRVVVRANASTNSMDPTLGRTFVTMEKL